MSTETPRGSYVLFGASPDDAATTASEVHKCPETGYCDSCDELGLNTYHGGLW